MENKSFRNRLGRFCWLWFLIVLLGIQIGVLLASVGFTFANWIGWSWAGVFLIIYFPLFVLEARLYNRAMEADKQNGISITPFRNIFLPWPKAAIGLSLLALFELLIVISLLAFTLYH